MPSVSDTTHVSRYYGRIISLIRKYYVPHESESKTESFFFCPDIVVEKNNGRLKAFLSNTSRKSNFVVHQVSYRAVISYSIGL